MDALLALVLLAVVEEQLRVGAPGDDTGGRHNRFQGPGTCLLKLVRWHSLRRVLGCCQEQTSNLDPRTLCFASTASWQPVGSRSHAPIQRTSPPTATLCPFPFGSQAAPSFGAAGSLHRIVFRAAAASSPVTSPPSNPQDHRTIASSIALLAQTSPAPAPAKH